MPLAPASSRRRLGTLASLSATIVLATTLAGCSANGQPPVGDRRSAADKSVRTETELVVRTSVARVHGELTPAQRKQLEREAERLVSRYLSAAYLNRRPTAGYRAAFPGFTPDARELARDDVATAADGAYRWATEVRPLGAVATLSVVAPEGRPAGATARVKLRMAATDDRRRREVTVLGRLLLTPLGDRWGIFGYDLSVAATPMRRSNR